MRILISNDDGYRARGINALREALKGLGDITVVAPDRNRSGAGNSLTLDVPLRVGKAEPDVYFVLGTPTDCVHLASSGLFPFEPDMVVSGINDGSNMGDHVLYSGTVAAATEGRFLGKPAVAVSLNTDDVRGDAKRYYETAAHYARVIVERLLTTPLVLQMGRATILNVNVPNLPLEEVKGIRVTRLGNHHRSGAVIRAEDPRGRPVYWVGPSGPRHDDGPGTDFHAVIEGYVSVTPLTIDLTNHHALDDVHQWFGPYE
ncbi:MAG TPA: 5'/3'-nucleotidase SurE [Steroidobacteraceae bacterium]|nr:5'/3'-nucleotidase SurE [Steroidobacteraceae bacterium]